MATHKRLSKRSARKNAKMDMASKTRKRNATPSGGAAPKKTAIAKAKVELPWEIIRQITREDNVAKFVSIL